MNHTTTVPVNVIDPFDLGEAVNIFGITGIKEALMRDAARVRELIIKSSTLTPDSFVKELHKVCGRLALLGAHTPRYISRKIRETFLGSSCDLSKTDLKTEMLIAIQAVERELVDRLEQLVLYEDNKTGGFALISIIALALLSYLCAAIGFLATLTITGAWIGFVIAFLSSSICIVVAGMKCGRS